MDPKSTFSSPNPVKDKLHIKKQTSKKQSIMDNQTKFSTPHVLLFPLPLQGPVNCMLKLAELLCLSNIKVTFLNTIHIHHRLLQHTDVLSRFEKYPDFCFQTVSDGLPEDHPRTIVDIVNGMNDVTKNLYKEMLISSNKSEFPVTVIIADGYLCFALDIALEMSIPLIHLETVSPCALWTFLCLPNLFESGEVPCKDADDLDVGIKSVPGMESFLRRRDLPSIYRDDVSNAAFIQFAVKENQQIPRARGLILNTFEELDVSVLGYMRNLCPNIYCIGPIHTMLKVPAASSNSLWAEERSCLSWLDEQYQKSVIFVSIGSQAVMTYDQLIEIWHGLVNSGKPFLWVRRPGSIIGECGDSNIPSELLEATKERGCIVEWVPQEAVLAHRAIGAFFTHSGWNSTLESIVERVPMICWPSFYDQQVNSRFVSEVWKVGLDMKDSCERGVVEKMVRDVMDIKRDEFEKSVDELGTLAAQSVAKGGPSCASLERLIEDIKLMSSET